MPLLTLLADAAQAAVAGPMIADPWTLALQGIGNIGFAVFFAAYTQVVQIPQLQKDHREAVGKIVDTHAATIKELVDEMKEQRANFERWMLAGK